MASDHQDEQEGGMNDDEFNKYIDNSIVPLFPNLEDVPSKCVLLKVDSGPGRNGTALLLKAPFQGVYLYPGLPNATSVQQKTDINYCQFKSVVRTNLKNIASTCFRKRINVPLKASTFGLICYSGVCPDLGVVLENALQAAFNTASNLHSWREVGAVPYTKKCLLDPKVRHDGMDVNDPQFDVYQEVQSQNYNSTMQLSGMGYSGNILCAKFIPEKIWERQAASAPVTVENTRERQEVLARTSTADGIFFLTGGQHLTADDGWIVSEMKERKTRAAKMEREKRDGWVIT